MLVYNGKKYYLRKNGYWVREKMLGEGKKRAVPLHRELWEEHHGPIPPGHNIHHIDGNKSNNTIENLECLSVAEHMRMHRLKDDAEGRLANFRKKGLWLIRTESGRRKRREGYRKFLREQPLELGKCAWCGGVMRIIRKNKKCCSDNCSHYLWVKRNKK